MSAVLDRLAFDEPTHTYRFEGRVVPSVTQVLAPLSNFEFVKAAVLEAASDFGRAVHRACELDDLGELDEARLDPALRPYLQGWRKFCQDNECSWDLIEERLYHASHRFAGTPDRYGTVAGKKAIVDIKSSVALYPSVGPQLAAYKAMIPDAPSDALRIAVQLKPDGSYVAKPHADRDDWALFLSLLTVRNWTQRHSITANIKE